MHSKTTDNIQAKLQDPSSGYKQNKLKIKHESF